MNWTSAYLLLGVTKQDVYTQKMIIKAERWGVMCDIAYASDLIEFEKQLNVSHARAMQRAVTWGETGHMIDADDVCLLHRMVFPDLEKDWVGDWRYSDVYIPGSSVMFPSYHVVPALMRHYIEDLEWWLNDAQCDPYDILAHLHLDFVRIHPFKDGNGRVSRMLLNYGAAYLGVPCIKIGPDERDLYLDILEYHNEKSLAKLFEDCSVDC